MRRLQSPLAAPFSCELPDHGRRVREQTLPSLAQPASRDQFPRSAVLLLSVPGVESLTLLRVLSPLVCPFWSWQLQARPSTLGKLCSRHWWASVKTCNPLVSLPAPVTRWLDCGSLHHARVQLSRGTAGCTVNCGRCYQVQQQHCDRAATQTTPCMQSWPCTTGENTLSTAVGP